MTTTTFTSGTTIESSWLNDVNDSVYNVVNSHVGFTQSGTGAVTRTNLSKMQESVSIFDFMTAAQIADVQAGTLTLSIDAAFAAACAASNYIHLPPGKYRFNSTATITGARGMSIVGSGASLVAASSSSVSNTVLVFDNAASGSNGLVFTDFVGLTLKDFFVTQIRGGAGGGKAIYLYNGHNFNIDGVCVDSQTGTSGKGIVAGGGTGPTGVFLGLVTRCKVFSQGGASFSFGYCTSLTCSSNYQVGGYYEVISVVYSTFNSCASEISPSYGYLISGSSNVTFNSCGGEQNAKGVFYLSTTTSNCVFNAPYGAANNTSADAAIGDLFQIDSTGGACEGITIINPSSVSPNGATVQSIYSNAGNGLVDVLGVISTLMPKGIGGNATWITTKLTRTGDGEVQSWTPAISGVWVNVGSPTLTGKYVKKGNLIFYTVTVTPGTSISCTKSTSTITGLPFSPAFGGTGSMVDDNVNSYGAVTVGATGIIYPQTSGVLTVPITISGTFII